VGRGIVSHVVRVFPVDLPSSLTGRGGVGGGGGGVMSSSLRAVDILQ
jgi:hypothetical protein